MAGVLQPARHPAERLVVREKARDEHDGLAPAAGDALALPDGRAQKLGELESYAAFAQEGRGVQGWEPHGVGACLRKPSLAPGGGKHTYRAGPHTGSGVVPRRRFAALCGMIPRREGGHDPGRGAVDRGAPGPGARHRRGPRPRAGRGPERRRHGAAPRPLSGPARLAGGHPRPRAGG